jgi:hypothetical protein
LKNAADFVLASLNASTYRKVCLGISLAAALSDDAFEHPAFLEHKELFSVAIDLQFGVVAFCNAVPWETSELISNQWRVEVIGGIRGTQCLSRHSASKE